MNWSQTGAHSFSDWLAGPLVVAAQPLKFTILNSDRYVSSCSCCSTSRNDSANVFNDQNPNAFVITGCELVSIDAAEGVAQQHGLPKAEMVDKAQQVIEIIAARVSGRVIGVAVATLIRSNHAPCLRQGGCERREGLAFHPMSVQGDELLATAAGIETRKLQTWRSPRIPVP